MINKHDLKILALSVLGLHASVVNAQAQGAGLQCLSGKSFGSVQVDQNFISGLVGSNGGTLLDWDHPLSVTPATALTNFSGFRNCDQVWVMTGTWERYNFRLLEGTRCSQGAACWSGFRQLAHWQGTSATRVSATAQGVEVPGGLLTLSATGARDATAASGRTVPGSLKNNAGSVDLTIRSHLIASTVNTLGHRYAETEMSIDSPLGARWLTVGPAELVSTWASGCGGFAYLTTTAMRHAILTASNETRLDGNVFAQASSKPGTAARALLLLGWRLGEHYQESMSEDCEQALLNPNLVPSEIPGDGQTQNP
ncbi:hypothetical protein [Anderseniella sp. Alg231-50]|uniref:hypothetical protein n=1 Tax=Anderseniella sp. Alg231-50 TaxID=1922226 RepID=UPI000D5590D0